MCLNGETKWQKEIEGWQKWLDGFSMTGAPGGRRQTSKTPGDEMWEVGKCSVIDLSDVIVQ